MKRRLPGNPKRRIRDKPNSEAERVALEKLALQVVYGGNPSHKRDPGDFNLSPPSQPREGKTLCDGAGIKQHQVAVELLRAGMKRGLVSVQERNGWPQYIWAVHGSDIPVEAILENSGTGTYHGYPLQYDDPFRDLVLERWRSS